MKVAVYFNLHKKCFSVRRVGPKGGLKEVIRHTDFVALRNVTFRVDEPGRQRVLRERKKNVHAYVIGDINTQINRVDYERVEVGYNPYHTDHFFEKISGKKAEKYPLVDMIVVNEKPVILAKTQ